jgi:hypothetical protein
MSDCVLKRCSGKVQLMLMATGCSLNCLPVAHSPVQYHKESAPGQFEVAVGHYEVS